MDVRLNETWKDDESLALNGRRLRPCGCRPVGPSYLRNPSILDEHIRVHNAALRVQCDHAAALEEKGFHGRCSCHRSVGSNATPPHWAPPWRGGPGTPPLAPTRPMIRPRATVSPPDTRPRLR